jgi:hypothetical protein
MKVKHLLGLGTSPLGQHAKRVSVRISGWEIHSCVLLNFMISTWYRFVSSSLLATGKATHLPSNLHQPKRWSPLPPLVAPAAGRRGVSFLRVVRVRACLLWWVVGVLGAMSGKIKLSQLHSHTGGDLCGGVSELMTTCTGWSFRLAARPSRHSSDLVRSVSRRVAGLCRRPGQGGFSGARMFVWRWWICHSSRLHRWEAENLGPRQHGDVPRSTCHSYMCLATRSRSVHRLTKPHWRWCSLWSGNAGGLAFLSACVSMMLEWDGGRWLRWLQKTLGIDSYLSISYGFICKVFRIIILFWFVFSFSRRLLHVTWFSINEICGCFRKNFIISLGLKLAHLSWCSGHPQIYIYVLFIWNVLLERLHAVVLKPGHDILQRD